MEKIEKKISVVVPCFREGKTIYQNLQKIESFLSQNFQEWEIIAVNDGSPDDTAQEIKKAEKDILGVLAIDNKINAGKGKAVRDGILKSDGDIVMFLDADLAMPIEDVGKFIAEIENGYDLAIASRFVPGLKVVKPVLWYRRVMEKIFRILRMVIISNYSVQDTQCGFKVFSRRATKDIFSVARLNRFAFDAEIIFIATQRGYKIKELPVVLQNPTTSSVRIFRDSLNMFCDLFKIRWNNFAGKYKKRA